MECGFDTYKNALINNVVILGYLFSFVPLSQYTLFLNR